MTSNPLEDLLRLQSVDTALDQLRHRRAHLPEQAELASVDSSLAELIGQQAQASAELAELAERQSAAESELSGIEERTAVINRRMYGGEVSASKDLQAMSGEVEHLKARASSLEDVVLELLEAREPMEQRVADLDAEAERLGAERAAIAARLAQAEAALDAELRVKQGEREQAAAGVPDDLVATYDRLRGRLGGVGVARVVANRCDGCHLTLPAAELDRVRHLPPGELYFCEQCSRILVP